MARTKSNLEPLPVIVVASSCDHPPRTSRHLNKPSIESISQSMAMLDIDSHRRPSRRKRRRQLQGHRHSSYPPGMSKDDSDATTFLAASSLYSSSSSCISPDPSVSSISISSNNSTSDTLPLTTRSCHFTNYRHYDEHGALVDAHRVRESCAAFRRWHACECGASMGGGSRTGVGSQKGSGLRSGLRSGMRSGVSVRHSMDSYHDQRQRDTAIRASSHLDDRRSRSLSASSLRHDSTPSSYRTGEAPPSPSAEHDTVTIERADCPFCQRRRAARGLDVWHFVRLEGQPVDEEIYEGYRRVW